MDDEQIIEAGLHGADAGWPGFTLTLDCVQFFQDNADGIWDMAVQVAEDLGQNVGELIAGFGRKDMLDNWQTFQNLMAWFALEETGRYLEANPDLRREITGNAPR
jgi:hypothetical protein